MTGPTISNGPEPVDARRAVALVKFTAPTRFDPAGINSVFEELSEDGRTGQTLLAMCAVLHGYQPHLGTDAGLQALQNVIENHRLRELGEQEQ